jgi:hypothetical protein
LVQKLIRTLAGQKSESQIAFLTVSRKGLLNPSGRLEIAGNSRPKGTKSALHRAKKSQLMQNHNVIPNELTITLSRWLSSFSFQAMGKSLQNHQ